MRILHQLAETIIIIAAVAAAAGTVAKPPKDSLLDRDKAAINRLHQQDIEATLSGKADDFARLWDDEAVRMEPGGPAEIGKRVIYANDKRQETTSPEAKTLIYKPEIKDLRIADGWAFEWGYFDTTFKESTKDNPVSMRGKLLRVLKREPDGSWKFARVMWNEMK